jgi:peptidoglycan hydrolase-like protein with peptidoglycan-binding domain
LTALRQTYAAIPLAERLAIQSDLVWSGDYNGAIHGEFNERAVAAVKAFQKRNKGKETGVLTPQERSALAAAVKEQQEQVGWMLVEDPVMGGGRLGVPGKLVSQSSPGKSGGRWSSTRGEVQIETFRVNAQTTPLAALFEQEKKTPASRKAEYNVLRGDFFVVSGLQGLKKFYVRAQIKGDDIRGITILYDQAMEGIMQPVVVAMSNAFHPFTERAAENGRRKVEYSTAMIASPAGHLVAGGDATEGCHVIVVAGHGPAERLAEDKAGNLALLRVNGANGLKPMALSPEPPRGSELTLLGVADPQLQAGGNVVTSASAKLGSVSGSMVGIEPAPALGFSGAAAIDGQGQLVGMVDVRPSTAAGAAAFQAALVPTASIRNFLQAEKVAPVLGRVGVADAKASLARVICVRK